MEIDYTPPVVVQLGTVADLTQTIRRGRNFDSNFQGEQDPVGILS